MNNLNQNELFFQTEVVQRTICKGYNCSLFFVIVFSFLTCLSIKTKFSTYFQIYKAHEETSGDFFLVLPHNHFCIPTQIVYISIYISLYIYMHMCMCVHKDPCLGVVSFWIITPDIMLQHLILFGAWKWLQLMWSKNKNTFLPGLKYQLKLTFMFRFWQLCFRWIIFCQMIQ